MAGFFFLNGLFSGQSYHRTGEGEQGASGSYRIPGAGISKTAIPQREDLSSLGRNRIPRPFNQEAFVPRCHPSTFSHVCSRSTSTIRALQSIGVRTRPLTLLVVFFFFLHSHNLWTLPQVTMLSLISPIHNRFLSFFFLPS